MTLFVPAGESSYFNGYEYKGYQVGTNLVIEGQNEYKSLRFSTPIDVYNVFKNLETSDKERFYSVLLNAKNKVIGVDMVSQCSVDSSPVHRLPAFGRLCFYLIL